MRITELRKKIGSMEIYVRDLSVARGSIHGLVGPNGCGKTTLLKMIMGITRPDSGTIDLQGLRPTDITMTSQRPYLMRASVYDNIVYPLKIRGIRIDQKEIDDLLEQAGLSHQKTQYAGSLSSGERQKMSFLRAIVFHPSLILIDETLSNLDPESEALFREMILDRRRQEGTSWLIVSHQWDRMNSIFDDIHFMEKGKIVNKDGKQEETAE